MRGQLISFRISCEDRQACIASVRHAAWSHVKIAHLKTEETPAKVSHCF